jgi:hypothetical protein
VRSLRRSPAKHIDLLPQDQANLGEWPKTAALPPTIATAVPTTAAGRLGILSSIDLEKIAGRLRTLLEDAFRVPHSRLEDCKAVLRDEALKRMRGAGHGVWTRVDLETVIRSHDGYIASSSEVESFVNLNRFPRRPFVRLCSAECAGCRNLRNS